MRGLRNLVAIVLICLLMTSVNTPIANAGGVVEDERLILSYFQSIDEKNWEKWLGLLGDDYSTRMETLLNNDYFQENKIGVYSIDDVVSVSDIIKIDSQGYDAVVEECEGTEHELYLVKVNLGVSKENAFYFNGENYNIMIVSTVNNVRKIVDTRLPLAETIETFIGETQSTNYEIMRFGSDAEVKSSASCSYTVNPATIVVWRWKYGDGSCETVNFKRYTKVVLAKEFGYVDSDADYHYAGAVAVKWFAWYKMVVVNPNNGFHVTDTNDPNGGTIVSCQIYDPANYSDTTVWSTLFNRVDQVWTYNIFDSEYKYVNTQHHMTKGEPHSGIMNSPTARELANQGYTYYDILNYYYGYSPESTGDLIVNYAGQHLYYNTVNNSDGSIFHFCKCGYKLVVNGLTALTE